MSNYHGPNLLSDNSALLEVHRDELVSWFAEERAKQPMPLYASVDIRDAGWKVAAVDANAYPAGFNNVGESEREYLSEQLQEWLLSEHPQASWLHIWPEKHTRNKGYVENLIVLQDLLSKCNCKVTVGSNEFEGISEIDGITGTLQLSETTTDGALKVDGEIPDVLILNNDLSQGPIEGIGDIPVAPPQAMGWFQRRKSNHFRNVQPYIDKAAEIIGIDPWLLGTHWLVSEDKCLEKDTCRIELAANVDNFIDFIRDKYESYGIECDPVIFVKNDSGTYGLGIIEISSGAELLNLSKRKVNKLTYGKGGSEAVDFLLQEGVPTGLKLGDSVIEPCVYGAGGRSSATFYRANSKKGEMTNLNTPSTIFMTSEEVESQEGGKEIIAAVDNWHALVAELAMLAMASELAELSE
ncbi:MAG: glutamate--cysteine ligase [Candidatus Thalassarchaeaceae archaeon]|jgi:glutamate--cysteine ligase|nr:glutamate--cysteine ligase [Candidatus Thalassarchaeaceae archaeon]